MTGTSTMLSALSASEAVAKIRDGRINSVDLVEACLGRIRGSDDAIGAWTHLDEDAARAQASDLDRLRQAGKPLGPLHGVPVGLKDIIDTAGMPTGRGSPIHQDRRPTNDAAIVERLREAGAVIMGKTVTTEFAFVHPGKTTNPHDIKRTPGGSSSGSAAAVAAGHVPLAIGSQTNGSTIRPASFCGVYGFKPTRGIVPRRGVLETSRTLDQIGVFGRSLDDVALLADVLAIYDPSDPMSYPRARPDMVSGARSDAPVEPNFAWFDLGYNKGLSSAAHGGFAELLEALGEARVDRIPAPKSFDDVIACHRVVHETEIARQLHDEIENHWDEISDTLKPILKRGLDTKEPDYQEALALVSGAETYFAEFFNDYDAVLTPSAAGEAPLRSPDSPSTGDPIFCTIWTFAGLPSLSVPMLVGENDLPIGVQLVGAQEEDDRLLRSARWLTGWFAED